MIISVKPLGENVYRLKAFSGAKMLGARSKSILDKASQANRK
jgi:hypothetical protein